MPPKKVSDFVKNIDLVLAVLDEFLVSGLVADVFEGNLTEAQMKCLFFVIRNQDTSIYKKIRISDVADALHISLPAATKAVKRLLEKGLIKKVRDLEDYRNILIKPTDKGIDCTNKYKEARKERMTAVYNQCTQEEFDTLLKSSQIFIEKNLDALNKNQLMRVCLHCGDEHHDQCIIKKKLQTIV